MFAESSASGLFRKFMGNETNWSTNQMARKPMNVNKNKLLVNKTWLFIMNLYTVYKQKEIFIFEK